MNKKLKQKYSLLCNKCKQIAGSFCNNPQKCILLKKERPSMFPYVEPDNYKYEGGIK